MTYRSIVLGCGGYLPKQVVTNDDLVQQGIDTSHEWIVERVGIHQRHIAADNELTSDLGVQAALKALKQGGVKAEDIDAIVVATTTPDHTFPATAVAIQANLGAHRAFAFDVQAVCSGFIYALAVADNFIKTGQARNALVIGAETMSRILDWQDRATCVLFADGAGALLLGRAREKDSNRGVLSTHLYSDGRFKDALYVDGGPGSTKTTGVIRMEGRAVFKHAVIKIGQAVEKALEAHRLTSQDIDWFIPHQANQRIIEGISEHFDLPAEKVIVTIDRHANTSAASIPLALAEAAEDGRLKPNHLIICEAMGGGFTWGSAVIRW